MIRVVLAEGRQFPEVAPDAREIAARAKPCATLFLKGCQSAIEQDGE